VVSRCWDDASAWPKQLKHLLLLGTTDIVEIKSIHVSPDPPQPGQNLTVNVVAYAHEVVEVRGLLYLLIYWLTLGCRRVHT
jgi:hypothetical protein